MNKSDFLCLEYNTLREEIKERKARIFKLAGFGVVGMPSAYFLAHAYKLEVLVLSLPVLICTVVLIYFSESRAIMRCGRYIRTQIESRIEDEKANDIKGWETWLEEKPKNEPDRRIVDKFVAISFYILFIFYYVASVLLAMNIAEAKFGILGLSATLGFYSGLLVMFIWFLITNFKYSTTTHWNS